MPTTEVVELQEEVALLSERLSAACREINLHRKRLTALENSIAGGIAAGGALDALPVSAGIRAKLGLAGLLTIEDVRAFNEDLLMSRAGLRRTDARKVRKALKKVDA